MKGECRKARREEQPSILCFSDTMNRRPLPTPPATETLLASRADEDSQLKEFEKLLLTSKSKDLSGFADEDAEGQPRPPRRRAPADVSAALGQLTGAVLAFGEKVERVERRLARIEERLAKPGPAKEARGGDAGYKAHTLSSKGKNRARGAFKKKGASTLSLGQSGKLRAEGDERVRALEREAQALKLRNKALKIDKNILMKMIKDMIDRHPENLRAIDHEVFMKTLEEQS